MTSQEQPRREALRPLRPLPSIAVPLLRAQRTAQRTRRMVYAGLALGLLALLGGGLFVFARRGDASRREGARTGEPPIGTPAVVQLPSEPEPLLEGAPSQGDAPDLGQAAAPALRAAGRYEHRIGKAPSFGDALRKAGCDSAEADQLVSALTGKLDFRRVQPDHAMVIERDADGALSRFEYRASPTQRYEAARTLEGEWQARAMKLEIESRRIERGGVVETSLGDALDGLKLGRALTGVFSDVFSRKLNFSTDTRRGDAFRVLLDEELVEGEFLRYGTIFALEYQGEKAGVQRAFWHESKQVAGDFFDEQGRALHGGWLRTPVRYDRISSGYGVRMHPVLKRKLLHSGIDYVAPSGTPVRAAAHGTVRFVGNKGANGNLIAIVHANGYETFYAHLSRFAPGIKAGTRVKQKQLIAYVGSTGRSTGPHLHFALKQGGRMIDPMKQLNGPGLPLPARELPAYKQRVRELLDVLSAIPLERPAPVTPPPEPAALELGEEEEL